MKAARQVALLSKVDELLRELKSVRIGRVGTSTSAESYGMPRSALGHVVSYLRQQRPNCEELLAFFRASPSIDVLEAQNDDNPAAHQKALAGVLQTFLVENPDLQMEEILFVWGWVHGRLPNQEEKGKGPPRSKEHKAPHRNAGPRPSNDFRKAPPKKEPKEAGFSQLGAALAKLGLKP